MKEDSVIMNANTLLIPELFFNGKDGFGEHIGNHEY